jgi:hypothetical protein
MIKISIISAFLFITIGGFSQNIPIDFEADGNGANWTWTVFENDDNPSLEIIDNPDKSGINVSNKVAKFTARVSGRPYAGCESQHGSDIGTFTLTPSTSTIKIMVWKSTISDVGIKLVDATNGSLGEIKKANTKTNEWELIEFNFSSREGIVYDQIVIFPDFTARGSEQIVYFDNITFGDFTPLAGPTTAAPTPTENAANVISIFSGAYDNKTVNTLRTDWSSAVYEAIMVDGNPTIKYSNLDFVGIETTGDNLIDASEMEYVHFDVWTPNATLYRLKIVDFGADGAFGGGDDKEHEVVFNSPAQEEWTSHKLPFTDFTNLTNRANLAQYIFSAQPTGSAVLYIDNIYFSKEGGIGVKNINASKGSVYPNPATTILNISLNDQTPIESYSLWSLDGKELISNNLNQSTLYTTVDISSLTSGIYILKVKTANGMTKFRIIVQ